MPLLRDNVICNFYGGDVTQEVQDYGGAIVSSTLNHLRSVNTVNTVNNCGS